MALTRSRGAWLGFLAMFATVALVRRAGAKTALVGVMILLLPLALSPSLKDRMLSAFEPERNKDRIYIWTSTLKIIKDYPVLGTGTGVFPNIYERYALPDAWERRVAYAHNLFLQLASESGLIGLAVFLALML